MQPLAHNAQSDQDQPHHNNLVNASSPLTMVIPGRGGTPSSRRIRARSPALMAKQPVIPNSSNKRVMTKIVINPSDYVRSGFRANGAEVSTCIVAAEQEFKPITPERMEAYTQDVLQAVRTNQLDRLKELYQNGARLDCCNRFGDTILNIACRRGHTDMVEFLIRDARVPLFVRDDCKKTPLHDACWAPTADFRLLDMLIREAPEQLLLPDSRGFSPFDYVRRNDWNKWVKFLWERKELLRPALRLSLPEADCEMRQ